jgi:hypothetical protein
MDTLAMMTVASLENCHLSPRELMLVRAAALISSGAPTGSYVLNVGPAADAGLTLDDIQDVLVAVAPIVGTSRVVQGVANVGDALGFVVALAELESELEEAEEEDS